MVLSDVSRLVLPCDARGSGHAELVGAVAPTCTISPWAIQLASWLRIALRMPLQLRALVSAADAPTLWDLRREARARLLAGLNEQ